MVLGEAGSNIETWKTGCTAHMESGSRRVSVRVSKDFKRTQKLLSELFGRSRGFEELHFDISMGSNIELGGRFASNIGQGLINLLGVKNGSAKFLVKLI